jgi:Ca2+-binding EF-hand superfamily protein
VFKEFDANGNGVLTVDELANMYARLQMSVERKYLQALLRKFDKNGNGVIEFEEFCEFLIHNNFK